MLLVLTGGHVDGDELEIEVFLVETGEDSHCSRGDEGAMDLDSHFVE